MTECATCNGYELVEDDTGMLDLCPDCARDLVVCPVHGQKVMTRGGVVVGKCWGCVNEAAKALAWMRAHKYVPRVAA